MFYNTLALAITTLREIKCIFYKVIVNIFFYYDKFVSVTVGSKVFITVFVMFVKV